MTNSPMFDRDMGSHPRWDVYRGRVSSANSVVDDKSSFQLCAGGEEQWCGAMEVEYWTCRMCFFFSSLLTDAH